MAAAQIGPTVATEVTDAIGWIVLRNENGVHVLNEQFPEALSLAVERMSDHDQVRCVVLTGKTNVFCAGADLSLTSRLREPAFARWWLKAHHDALAALCELPKPTIAAVNGAAFGAGFNLALACDLVIASTRASFCQAFVRIGLASDMGSLALLCDRVGVARARELMLTGRALDASEAARLGAVDEVVDPARLGERSRELAAELAAGPPLAQAAIKRGIAESAGMGLRESLDRELELQLPVLASEDFGEGAAAFVAKREPNFRGR